MGNKQIYQLDEASGLNASDYMAIDQAVGSGYGTAKATVGQLQEALATAFVKKTDIATSTQAGLVEAGGGNAGKVWATDTDGNPWVEERRDNPDCDKPAEFGLQVADGYVRQDTSCRR